jgi:dephospho-CoA kinase
VVDPASSFGQEGLRRVLQAFGDELRDPDSGNLDRRKLRHVIANSEFERDRLERLLHPLILKSLQDTAKEWETKGFELAFVEGSRLLESGYVDELKGLIVVTAPMHFRIKRVMQRDRVSWEDAEKIMKLQNEERLLQNAFAVWTNDKDPADMEHQIENFLSQRGKKS